MRTIRGVTLDVVETTYGRPALEALARAVAAAKADEPLAPVTVVVPSNHVGVTARRMLATGSLGPITSRGTGIIGVTFLTPYRLAELLGAPGLAAARRRPVSAPVIAAALRQALRDDPGVFGPVADHPATEEALVAAYGELADLSSAGLDRLAAQSPRAADVVRLSRRARAILAERWYDEADLVTAARAMLTADAAVPGELGRVVVYLPQDLTRRSAALLRDLATALPTAVLVGLTGSDTADRGVTRSLSRLGAVQQAPGDIAAGWPVHPATTRIVTTSDADDEVRSAIRVVLDATRDGTPLERIALLYPTDLPYARLVHEHLVAAGIPYNGAASSGLAARVLGRTMLGLLALRDHGYRRRDVLGLLTSAPLRGPLVPQPAPTAEWERLSRQAAVAAGRDQWDRRLGQLAEELDRRAEQHTVLETAAIEPEATIETDNAEPAAEPDVDVDAKRDLARIGRQRRRAERVRSLRDLVLRLVDRIEQAASAPQTWRERVRWMRDLASGLLGGESARALWPPEEQKASQRIEAALDRLVTLDEIDGPVPLDVFRRTLELELDADLGRVGRFGEGILVGPLSFGVGVDLDLLVVLGMAEGVLPSRPGDDSLLPDTERQATNGELPLRREHLDRQHRQLHATLASARRHVLSAPRGDLRISNEHVLSRWLVEITESAGEIEHVPSFAHGVTHVAVPATAQEYRLRVPQTSNDDPIIAAGRQLRGARRSHRFTRFDGNLASQPVSSPLEDVVSATRLESWAVCPHAYFMRHLLRVEPVEDPAETLWISPLDRGSLVHEILERFLLAVLARPAEAQPGPDDPWTADDHRLLATIGAELCAEYEARGVVGRTLFWQRDQARILGRVDRLLGEDDARRRAVRSRPIAAELAFGLPGSEVPAVDVPIADSEGARALRFRGAADRIDLGDDGTLRVVDYKTGRPDDYRGLSETNPDDHGTHLQLVVYGLAARAHHRSPDAAVAAEYWFVRDGRPLTTIGYEVTDDVLARVGQTLATIVDGIEAGVFPPHPTASSSDPFMRCRYCNPDGLGETDRRAEWERKRSDPALAAYTELAEGAS